MTRESEVKGCDLRRARNGRSATSEYILYGANVGYQQTLLPVAIWPAKKTGLRSHRHHQHHRTGGLDPLERHETPAQGVLAHWKPGSSASAFGLRLAFTLAPAPASSRLPGQLIPAVSSRLLRLARVCPVSSWPTPASAHAFRLTSTLAFALAFATASEPGARPGRAPGSDQARRSRQQRSLGSERGLATPSPDGKGEISLGPSITIMPVDSYSTLGRSCEPAFKWIPDPGQPRVRARAARQRQALAGG